MLLLSEFEIQYLNPIHHGYPEWPGVERWLRLFQIGGNKQIVMTKGLSYGIDQPFEIYLETDEEINAEDFSSSWQANLVYEMGKIVPNVDDVVQRLEKNSYLVVQVEIDGAPSEWSLDDKNGNIGLFVGLENPVISESAKAFKLLNVKLMRPLELLYSIQNDFQGRIKLAELYNLQGNATVSNLERQSVI